MDVNAENNANNEVLSAAPKFDDITNGLRELDMEHYDDEDDDGIYIGLVFFLPFELFFFNVLHELV